MPLLTGKHIGFHQLERNLSAMDKLCMYSHVQKKHCPKKQPIDLCSNRRPMLDDSPRRPFQHWNQACGLLAILVAAGEENQLGLHWPCKVDFGSALRAVSSVFWSMTFLGKQQHKITKNHQIQIALIVQIVPSLTFRTARSTPLFAQIDAACWSHSFTSAFQELSRAHCFVGF